MDNYYKNLSFILTFLIILFLLMFSPALIDQKELSLENNFLSREGLVFFNGNTLLPVVSPTTPKKISESVPVIVTAYSSTIWETWGDPFITASGSRVREGIIANNLLPFGTKIRLPEIYDDKVFVVEDRMNSRKGNYHFDIWFPSYNEAKEFGVKRTYLEILEN